MLNPALESQTLKVMSLSDGNTIQAESVSLSLNRYEIGTIEAGAGIVLGSEIKGTGAFVLGSDLNRTDLPVPASFQGTRFVVPHIRNFHSYNLLSVDSDANLIIQRNGVSESLVLTKGVVMQFDAGSDNTISGIIDSDVPILLTHIGMKNGAVWGDVFPVPPAAKELWGIRSKQIIVGAVEDNTSLVVYSSGGASQSYSLNSGSRTILSIGSNTSQGRGDAFRLVSDKPIMAAQYGDSDGSDATAFWPRSYLANQYGIPIDTQYVAVVCPEPDTELTLIDGIAAPIVQSCSGSLDSYPGKAYFGSSTNGVNINAGAYIQSTKPVYIYHEASSPNDEHQLLGQENSYYVLDPWLQEDNLSVMSLADSNLVIAGSTVLNLNEYEIGSIPAGVDLSPGGRLFGTKPFDVGNAIDGSDMPVPSVFIGLRFSVPHLRGFHTYDLFSPSGDAEATINIDGVESTVALPQGQSIAFDAGNVNATVGLISATRPILVYHRSQESLGSGVRYDAYPVAPLATELWGIRSSNLYVSAFEDTTSVTAYADNNETQSFVLNAGEMTAVTVGDQYSQGGGGAIHIVSDKPLSGVRYDDGDGGEITSLWPIEYRGNKYGIPVNTQYIAAVCVEDNTKVILVNNDNTKVVQDCSASGNFPGKIFFGSAASGTSIAAGAYVESDKPIFLYFENSESEDEKNLLGTVVIPSLPPIADIVVNVSQGDVPLNVQFDGTNSSGNGGSPILSYQWDFGDGNSGNGATINNTYTASGSYLATLTVTTESGETDATTQAIIVNQSANTPPFASFNATPSNGNAPLNVVFDATSSNDSDGTISSYSWDFGDGQAGTGINATNTYAAAGSYIAELTVTDDDGDTDSATFTVIVDAPNVAPIADIVATPSSGVVPLTVIFDASASSDSDGTITSYAWDYGDGQSGTGQTANHDYTLVGSYIVTLTVTDDDGDTGSITSNITVSEPPNSPPTAVMTAIPEAGHAPLDVIFDATSSNDSDGTISSYSWDFGDGQAGTGINATNTYAAAGSYIAELTVTDDDGDTDSATFTVIVDVPNIAPIADIVATPSSGVVPLTVNFDASASSDSDGTITSYAWDYGDGQNGTGQTSNHDYTLVGSYTVSLTVTDDDGDTGSVTSNITVSEPPNSPPTAVMTAMPEAGHAPLDVIFDAVGSSDSDGSISGYSWDFGDGNSGFGVTTIHTYPVSGSYVAMLTVTDNDGDTNSALFEIVVDVQNIPPSAVFSTNVTAGELPLVVGFNGASSTDSDGTITSYSWDFGEGGNGTGLNTSHTYTSAGSFNAVLTVIDDDGASSTANLTITVTTPLNAQPIAEFELHPSSGTAPLNILANAGWSKDLDGDELEYEWLIDGVLVAGNLVSSAIEGPQILSWTLDVGTYDITLNISDKREGNPKTDSITKSIQVNAKPFADFIASPLSGASPLAVDFDASASASSIGYIDQYIWDFGDGTAGEGVAVSHTYDAPGQHEATLRIVDDNGGVANTTKIIEVSTSANPVANFLATPNSGELGSFGFIAFFNATGSSASEGEISSYEWDFGDGSIGSGSTITHFYTTSGTFVATLTITDKSGKTDTISKPIEVTGVSSPDNISFRLGQAYVDENWSTINLGQSYTSMVVVASVTMLDTSATPVVPRIRNADGSSFDLRLQSPANQNINRYDYLVSYFVLEEGIYNIGDFKLEALKHTSSKTSSSGAWSYEPHAYFNTYENPVILGQVMTFNDPRWSVFWASSSEDKDQVADFSGYSASKHVGEDVDTLRVDEEIGVMIFEQGEMNFNSSDTKLIAGLTDVPVVGIDDNATGYTQGLENLTSTYTAWVSSASVTNDGSWPVLMGSASVDTYGVTLGVDEDTILDSERSASSQFVAYLVWGGNGNAVSISPLASFSTNPDTGVSPETIEFDASASSDDDGTIDTYHWNFGDGYYSEGQVVNHTYTQAGIYDAQLTVVDNSGDRNSVSKSITIARSNPPTADFTISPLSGNAPLAITFDASVTNDPDSDPIYYEWWVDDIKVAGDLSRGISAAELITSNLGGGLHSIKLVVSDGFSNVDNFVEVIKQVQLNVPPESSYIVSPQFGEAPLNVTFDASGSFDEDGNITAYYWDFGDEQSDSGISVTHNYAANGTYLARLTVTDNDGGVGVSTSVVYVKENNPSSDITPVVLTQSANTSLNPKEITGIATANREVRLYVNNEYQASTTSDMQGNWSIKAILNDGSNSIWVTSVSNETESQSSNFILFNYVNQNPRDLSGLVISEDMVLTPGTNSLPYIIRGRVTVQSSATLTILAGTKVELK